jgi:O-antigen/teichoic acid export membrane protein
MHQARDISKGQYGSRIGLGAAVQFAGVIAQQVLRFGSNWLIAHLFGPAIMGMFQLSLTSWSALEMSFSGGLVRAIMRYLPHHLAREEHAEAKGVVRVGLYTAWIGGGTLALVVYLLSDVIAMYLLKKPETAPVLRTLALLMPVAATSSVIWATARALGSFKFIFYQFMMVPALFVIGIAAVSAVHGEGRLLAWAYTLSYVLPLIPLWRYYHRLMAFVRDVTPRLPVRPFLAFAGLGALMWLAEFTARNVDLVLVGRMRTLSEAGVYGIATRNATLCSTVMISINAFFMPTISSLYSGGRMDEFRAIFRKGTLWILIVGAPLVVYAMSFSEPIMLFFGRNFGLGAWALWMLAFAQLFNQGTGLIASALLMADRQHSVLVANIAGIGVTFGLCMVLIPIYGLNGAAIAMSASVVFVNLTMCVWGYITLRLSPFSRSYFKPIIAAAVAGIISQNVVQRLPLGGLSMGGAHLGKVLITLLVGMAIFGIIYVAGMWALGAKDEALKALQAVRSGLNRRGRPAADGE